MESLYLLIPLAIIIAFVIAGFFFWSVKSGQFDDLKGPAHSILMDDDSPPESEHVASKINAAKDVSTNGESNG